MKPSERSDYGRIRLWRHGADLLTEVLRNERDLLCLARKNRPTGETSTEYNLRIKHVDQVLSELGRMRAEKDWDEPFREDPEGSGPPTPPA